MDIAIKLHLSAVLCGCFTEYFSQFNYVFFNTLKASQSAHLFFMNTFFSFFSQHLAAVTLVAGNSGLGRNMNNKLTSN